VIGHTWDESNRDTNYQIDGEEDQLKGTSVKKIETSFKSPYPSARPIDESPMGKKIDPFHLLVKKDQRMGNEFSSTLRHRQRTFRKLHRMHRQMALLGAQNSHRERFFVLSSAHQTVEIWGISTYPKIPAAI
jgi:hypothetical protein